MYITNNSEITLGDIIQFYNSTPCLFVKLTQIYQIILLEYTLTEILSECTRYSIRQFIIKNY